MSVAKQNLDYTEHDRQDIIVAGPITTTSTTFVDIPGAQITTKDLDEGDETGNYQVFLSLSLQQSNNNTFVTFRVVINGVPGDGRTVNFGPNTANSPQHATLIGQAEDVIPGTFIKFQWLVGTGTGQINSLRMMMDGVRDSRVVV